MIHLPVIMFRGLLIGILVSAPMGPIGMLCIQRTLNRGRWPAFFTGVGAALSDLIYCLLTGLGLSFVTDFIQSNQSALQAIGSVVLIVYAACLFVSNPSRALQPTPMQAGSYWEGLRHRLPLHFFKSADSLFHNRTFRAFQLPRAGIQRISLCCGLYGDFLGRDTLVVRRDILRQ